MNHWISILIFLFIFGCIGDRHKLPEKDIILNTISVKEYIQIIQNEKKINKQHIYTILVMPADTGWVKKADIPYLIKLISSNEPAPCIMNVVSSILPFERSAIGGHAVQLIKSYRLHTPFPDQLTECPKIDSSEVAAIKKWWANQKH